MVNQRESIRTDALLDEALDEFERCWSADVRYLPDFVAKRSEINQPQSIAELIRADIDRRYAANLDVDLASYFETFPGLYADAKIVTAIGFEDFRSRRSRNLCVSSNRWSWIPGIDHESWYVAIRKSASLTASSHSPVRKTHSGIAKRFNDSGEAFAVASDSPGSEEPRVGDRFGEFQLLAILGKGSFSTVFLATQLGLASRYVAIKVVRRALDEPAHLARLQHTGIVPLYSLHRIGPYCALCMPYFGSATLADWFRNSDYPSRDGQSLVGTILSAQMQLTTIEETTEECSLNSKEIDSVRVWNSAGAQSLEKLRSLNAPHSILWLAQRLTAALAHAHERGVIHGDLKPANVLIRNDGEPALIDFNLSKNFEQEAVAWAGGTLPYMSPEQLRMLLGLTTQTDASSDVYSLGIILFELIENRLPFSRPLSQAETDVKVALDSRKRPPFMNSSMATVGLKAIVQKCLSFSVHERYASALPLFEDIEREIALRPLLHAKESIFTGRIPKVIRRYPRLFSAGPIALISVLAIGLISSLAVTGWKRTLALDAQSRLGRFRADSEILLSEMVDPTPTQWDYLLGETNRLANDLLAMNFLAADGVEKEQVLSALKWLSPVDRVDAQEEFTEFCITATALTCSSAPTLNSGQRNQLQKLLSACNGLSGSVKTTTVLNGLCELVRDQDQPGELRTRYESVISSLERQLDAADSPELQHGLIELLQARSDIRHGQERQAMERLRSIDVHSIPAHLYWMVSGDAQAQLQQLEAAVQSYSLAIGAAPKSVAAYVQRAEALQQLRIFKSAEADYSSAITISPSVSTLYLRRALVRENLGDMDGAIKDMDAALDFEPESNRLLLARARLHHHANRRDDYLKDFKKGITATPKAVEDWVSRALAQLPRYPLKAKADLQAALLIDPDSILALQNLAHLESEHLHDMKAAMAVLDQILESSPENEAARAGRSVLLARQGQVQECLQDIEFLSKREIKLLPSTLYQLGCAHALISKENEDSGENAVRLLALAIRRGYGADIIATDSDLDPIRDQASFVALSTVSEFYRAN